MINSEELFIKLTKEFLLLSMAQKSNKVEKLIYNKDSAKISNQTDKIRTLTSKIKTAHLENNEKNFFQLLNSLLVSYYISGIYYFNYKYNIQNDITTEYSFSNNFHLIDLKYYLINLDGYFMINKNTKKAKKLIVNSFLVAWITNIQNVDQKILLNNKDYFELFKNIIDSIFNEISLIESKIIDFYFSSPNVFSESYIISNSLINEIFKEKILSNQSQINEWADIFTSTIESPMDAINDLQFRKLPIDSIFFSKNQMIEILQKLNLPNKLVFNLLDGLLINSENLNGLLFLKKNLNTAIDCIYIDPPYNTGSGDFLYHDNYQKDQWYWLLENRIQLSYELLNKDGILFISIDDNEIVSVRNILDHIFDRFVGMYVWHKKTQPSFLNKELISVTEYILVYKKGSGSINMKGGFTDPNKHTELLNISNEVTDRSLPKENTIIYNNGKLFTGIIEKGIYGNNKLRVTIKNTVNIKEGVSDQNLELIGRFRWIQTKIDSIYKENRTIVIKNLKTLRPTVTGSGKAKIRPPITLLSKKINDIPTNTDGNFEMKNLFKIPPFYYPKPVDLIKFLIDSVTFNNKNAIILDFFAGSGTTGHAVINLNRQDGGKRKFILIEQADYFDTILIPRIKKVLYSDEWYKGLPKKENSIKAIIKVIKLNEKHSLDFKEKIS